MVGGPGVERWDLTALGFVNGRFKSGPPSLVQPAAAFKLGCAQRWLSYRREEDVEKGKRLRTPQKIGVVLASPEYGEEE